jgi:hypothetical protein
MQASLWRRAPRDIVKKNNAVDRSGSARTGQGDGAMTLKIVGAGLGRTGTKSMQTALNMLGFGPCHHMIEVFAHPESMALWIAAGAGQADWDAIFLNYRSMVDFPGAAYWREIAAHYPDARVLLTLRDADAWFDSTQATIFAPDGMSLRDGPFAPFFNSVFSRVVGTTRALIHDRAFMTDYFHRHTEAVKAAIPAERLLIYNAGEGWDRLCKFLDVPVPTEPFPSENSRAEFIGRVVAHRNSGQ